MSSPDSHELLDRYRRGDSRAAGEVFDRYVARLLGLLRHRISPRLQQRVEADDVVQSAFRSFFARAANEEYVLLRAGDLWRLLATITLSKLRRQVEVHTAAKRSIRKEQTIDAGVEVVATFADDPSPAQQSALVDELEYLLGCCQPEERRVLELRLAGETIEDIAQQMGRSQRTVRRWLQTARSAWEQRLLDIQPPQRERSP